MFMDVTVIKEHAKKNNLAFGKAFNKSREELRYPIMVKLQEEVGELADAIITKDGLVRKEKLKHISDEKLADEVADVIFTAACVADIHGVDIEKALENKLKILKERWKY